MARKKAKARKGRATKVINLKKLTRASSESALKRALEQASGRKIAIVVLNAPFKLAA
jgi:hypothetical protein